MCAHLSAQTTNSKMIDFRDTCFFSMLYPDLNLSGAQNERNGKKTL